MLVKHFDDFSQQMSEREAGLDGQTEILRALVKRVEVPGHGREWKIRGLGHENVTRHY